MGSCQIGNTEVEDGTQVVQLRCFRQAEHEAHSAAVKESQVGYGEQQWQTQRITVECRGARQVVNDDGDLPDILDAEIRRSGGHGQCTSGSNLVSIANYMLLRRSIPNVLRAGRPTGP